MEDLKERNVTVCDLMGINPARNPGSYQFKAALAGNNGKDVYYLGRFDSSASIMSALCIAFGDAARSFHQKVKTLVKRACRVPLWSKAAN